MADVFAEIDELLRQLDADLEAVTNADQLEQLRIKWLGGKGLLKTKMSLIGQAPPDQKRAVGQRLNALKDKVTAGYEAKKAALAEQGGGGGGEEGIDVTEPGRRPAIG